MIVCRFLYALSKQNCTAMKAALFNCALVALACASSALACSCLPPEPLSSCSVAEGGAAVLVKVLSTEDFSCAPKGEDPDLIFLNTGTTISRVRSCPTSVVLELCCVWLRWVYASLRCVLVATFLTQVCGTVHRHELAHCTCTGNGTHASSVCSNTRSFL